LAFGALAVAPPAAPAATPIPQDPAGLAAPAPFVGSVAVPRRVSAPPVPGHPFMAPNGRSNIHDDAWMTDTYTWSGPLGRGIGVRSASFNFPGFELCGGTVAFDRRGRLETICIASDNRVTLRLLDPDSLDRLASYALPPRRLRPGANPFQDFSGGGYFYLDRRDRAVVPTNDLHLYVLAQRPGGGFARVEDYDLSSTVSADDRIGSALPDRRGRIWFVSRFGGVVGVVDRRSGRVRAMQLGEAIGNSFAVDPRSGVYVATDAAMYRFGARRDGVPRVVWRKRYRNIGIAKPGQVDAGTGTTPTLMGRRYVAIADNADPMNVVVYRRAKRVRGSRLVCEQAVFKRGASATENSLIGTRRSLIVENNFGYQGAASTTGGLTTAPGIERVDVERDGRGCHAVWRSGETAPSVVPKLSLAAGLVYTYTKPPGLPDRWYLTTLSFRTGRTVYNRLVGTGNYFNNNYAGLAVSCRGEAYLGVLGGTVKLADSRRPTPPTRIRLKVSPNRATVGRATAFSFRATTRDACGRRPVVRGALIRLAGERVRTNGRGRARMVVRLRRAGRFTARARKRGLLRGRASVSARPA